MWSISLGVAEQVGHTIHVPSSEAGDRVSTFKTHGTTIAGKITPSYMVHVVSGFPFAH
jgi:hypothetical protein